MATANAKYRREMPFLKFYLVVQAQPCQPNCAASLPGSWTASIFRTIENCGHIAVMSQDTSRSI